MIFPVIILTILISVIDCDVPTDEIKYLPGLKKQPYFKQYSGYLNATGTKRLHYWFIQSGGDYPLNDPVVLWLNGGPGCSSMDGLLQENGPFKVLSDGKSLAYNPSSWNKIANLLYLEAPAGVGYSYSEDKNYTTDDNQVSLDNHLALKDFFSKYQEYSKNEFFITGESYGGIYVPTLASRVLEDSSINFQGFAVGNGLSSVSMNTDSIVYFAYYHGLYGEDLWETLIHSCCNGNETRCKFSASENPDCKSAVNAVQEICWSSGLNVYNLYGECIGPSGTRFDVQENKFVTTDFGWMFPDLPSKKKEREILKNVPLNKIKLSPSCLNTTALTTFMNLGDIRTALHVSDAVPKWEICSIDVQEHYGKIYNDVSKFYLQALEKKKRLMVYNGDVDMACNFLGDEWFVDSLNQKLVMKRKPWFYTANDETKQVAGYVKQYENITFVTIRGAGHMVPGDKPIPALALFTNFIKNIPF